MGLPPPAAAPPEHWLRFSFLVIFLSLAACGGFALLALDGIHTTTLKLRSPPSDTLIGRTYALGLEYYHGQQFDHHPLYWGISRRNVTRDVDTQLSKKFFLAATAALSESEFAPFITTVQSIFNIPRNGDRFVIGNKDDNTMLIKIDNNMSDSDHHQQHLLEWMTDFADSYSLLNAEEELEWTTAYRVFVTGVGAMTADLTKEVWIDMVEFAGIMILLALFGGSAFVLRRRRFTSSSSSSSIFIRCCGFLFVSWFTPLTVGFGSIDAVAHLYDTSSFAPMMIFLGLGAFLFFCSLQSLQDAVAIGQVDEDQKKGQPPLLASDQGGGKERRSQPASRTTSQLQRTLVSFGIQVSTTPRADPSPGVATGKAPSSISGPAPSAEAHTESSHGTSSSYVSGPLTIELYRRQIALLQLLPFAALGFAGAAAADAQCIGTAGTATLVAVAVAHLIGAALRPLHLVAFFPCGLSNTDISTVDSAASSAGLPDDNGSKKISKKISSADEGGALDLHGGASSLDTFQRRTSSGGGDGESSRLLSAPVGGTIEPPSTAKAFAMVLLLCGLSASCAVLCTHAIGDVGFFNQVPRSTQRVKDGHLLLDTVTAAASGPTYFVFLPSAGRGGVLSSQPFWESVGVDAFYIADRLKQPTANISSVTYVDGINITYASLAQLLLGLGNITAYPYLWSTLVDPTNTLIQVGIYPTFDPYTEAAAPYQAQLDALCNEIQRRRPDVYSFVGWYGANAGNWQTMLVVIPQWLLGSGLGLAGAFVLMYWISFNASRQGGLRSCEPTRAAMLALITLLPVVASTLVANAMIIAIFQYHKNLHVIETIGPSFLASVSGVTWMVFPFAQPILTSLLLTFHVHAALRRQQEHMTRTTTMIVQQRFFITLPQLVLLIFTASAMPFVFADTTMLNEIGLLFAFGCFFDAVVGHPGAALLQYWLAYPLIQREGVQEA